MKVFLLFFLHHVFTCFSTSTSTSTWRKRKAETENSTRSTTITTTRMNFHLPPEIATKILAKVPITSVLRFRCVSKAWCSLIDQPQFPYLHNTDNQPSIILSHRIPLSPDLLMANDNCDGFIDISKIRLSFANKRPVYTVGTSNGLVCLRSCYNNETYIINPITEEHAIVPDNLSFPSPVEKVIIRGFGFCPSIKKFKVVLAKDFPLQFQVYTQGSSSWRIIGKPPDSFSGIDGALARGIFVNESLHWITLKPGAKAGVDKLLEIVKFDLKNETFGVVPYPEFCNLPFPILLGDLGGCLSLFNLHPVGGRYQIWILKNYNVRQSWTKEFVIRQSVMNEVRYRLPILPLSVGEDGELVLLCNHRFLISYNIGTGKVTVPKYRVPELTWLNRSAFYDAFHFVGTLIDPNRIVDE